MASIQMVLLLLLRFLEEQDKLLLKLMLFYKHRYIGMGLKHLNQKLQVMLQKIYHFLQNKLHHLHQNLKLHPQDSTGRRNGGELK